ncbi:transcriptional repressor general negative regulator of transcription subunit 4 [Tulasnella sp. 403]|nr:transcriptional repressor general negative regulator of transcription subunit 4 [Tulasnella sp. 403]
MASTRIGHHSHHPPAPPNANGRASGNVLIQKSHVVAGVQDAYWSDDEEEQPECPLCVAEMDMDDLNFKPCPCGYQICRFCYHHIKENLNGRCPACRREYSDETVEWKAMTPEDQKRLQQQKKQKEKEKKELESLRRVHLPNMRVVQRNVVYVTGLGPRFAKEELLPSLRSHDYFGQYGKINKIVLVKRNATATREATTGIYITYHRREDAARAIAGVDGSPSPGGGGEVMRASYGTTKYCMMFLRNLTCTNPNCMELHEWGDEKDSFTKEDLATLKHALKDTESRQKYILSKEADSGSPDSNAPRGVLTSGSALPRTASWASKYGTSPKPAAAMAISLASLPRASSRTARGRPAASQAPRPPQPSNEQGRGFRPSEKERDRERERDTPRDRDRKGHAHSASSGSGGTPSSSSVANRTKSPQSSRPSTPLAASLPSRPSTANTGQNTPTAPSLASSPTGSSRPVLSSEQPASSIPKQLQEAHLSLSPSMTSTPPPPSHTPAPPPPAASQYQLSTQAQALLDDVRARRELDVNAFQSPFPDLDRTLAALDDPNFSFSFQLDPKLVPKSSNSSLAPTRRESPAFKGTFDPFASSASFSSALQPQITSQALPPPPGLTSRPSGLTQEPMLSLANSDRSSAFSLNASGRTTSSYSGTFDPFAESFGEQRSPASQLHAIDDDSSRKGSRFGFAQRKTTDASSRFGSSAATSPMVGSDALPQTPLYAQSDVIAPAPSTSSAQHLAQWTYQAQQDYNLQQNFQSMQFSPAAARLSQQSPAYNGINSFSPFGGNAELLKDMLNIGRTQATARRDLPGQGFNPQPFNDPAIMSMRVSEPQGSNLLYQQAGIRHSPINDANLANIPFAGPPGLGHLPPPPGISRPAPENKMTNGYPQVQPLGSTHQGKLSSNPLEQKPRREQSNPASKEPRKKAVTSSAGHPTPRPPVKKAPASIHTTAQTDPSLSTISTPSTSTAPLKEDDGTDGQTPALQATVALATIDLPDAVPLSRKAKRQQGRKLKEKPVQSPSVATMSMPASRVPSPPPPLPETVPSQETASSTQTSPPPDTSLEPSKDEVEIPAGQPLHDDMPKPADPMHEDKVARTAQMTSAAAENDKPHVNTTASSPSPPPQDNTPDAPQSASNPSVPHLSKKERKILAAKAARELAEARALEAKALEDAQVKPAPESVKVPTYSDLMSVGDLLRQLTEYFNVDNLNFLEPDSIDPEWTAPASYNQLLEALSSVSAAQDAFAGSMPSSTTPASTLEQMIDALSQAVADLLRLLPRATWADQSTFRNTILNLSTVDDSLIEGIEDLPDQDSDIAALTSAMERRGRYLKIQLDKLEGLQHDINRAAVRAILALNDRAWDFRDVLPTGDGSLERFERLGEVKTATGEWRSMTVTELEAELVMAKTRQAEVEAELSSVLPNATSTRKRAWRIVKPPPQVFREQTMRHCCNQACPLDIIKCGRVPAEPAGRSLFKHGIKLIEEIDLPKDIAALDHAVDVLDKALDTSSQDSESVFGIAEELCFALRLRFNQKSQIGDLERAIGLYREVLSSMNTGHPKRSDILRGLAAALADFSNHTKNSEASEQSIEILQRLLGATPYGHPKHVHNVLVLSEAFKSRFICTGDMRHIRVAVDLLRGVIESSPAGSIDRLPPIITLAQILQPCLEQPSQRDLLEYLIKCYRDLVDSHSIDDEERYGILSGLAKAMCDLHSITGHQQDLAEAIQLYNQLLSSLPHNHHDRHSTVINFSAVVGQAVHLYGDLSNLDVSVKRLRELLEFLCLRHEIPVELLVNLAATLGTRYQHMSNLNDLTEAIDFLHQSLSVAPPDYPGRHGIYLNLGHAYARLFHRTSKPTYLDSTIEAYKESVALLAEDHPSRPHVLADLATAYYSRFKATGLPADLDISIAYDQAVLHLEPRNHPTNFQNIASKLAARFEIANDPSDLENAIRFYERALHMLGKGDPGRPMVLVNLAQILRRHRTPPIDPHTAIRYLQEAVSLTPPGHEFRPNYLMALSEALQARFNRDGVHNDLTGAMNHLQEALTLCPQGHSVRFSVLKSLAIVHYSQYIHTKDQAALITAIFYSDTSRATSSQVMDRLAAARLLLRIARDVEDKDRVLAASRSVVGLLELASSRCNRLKVRHMQLSGTIIEEAREELLGVVSFLIGYGEIETAVELLEHGRVILLSSMSRYRTPLEDLHVTHPDLAERFEAVSHQLESLTFDRGDNNEVIDLSNQSQDRLGMYRRLSDDRNQLLDEIRRLDGYSNFLKPAPFVDLQEAAKHGPVVIINISEARSDAIIIPPSGRPILVPLVDATPGVIQRLSDQRLCITSKKLQRGIETLLHDLWVLVVEPIAEALQKELDLPRKSRIWWCPTAAVSRLPLHAAGVYTKKDKNLPDLYISSYTTTLSSLIRARKGMPDATSHPHLLAVGQPSTPGRPALPNVQEEIKRIAKKLPNCSVLQGPEGTRDAVLAGLKENEWVHLACHGHLCSDDPLSSHFSLHDGSLRLIEIVEQHLPKAELAVLSACLSAASNHKTADEGLHLAAAMQFAGFRSVIATMWEMYDEDGPTLAAEFYRNMMKGRRTHCTKAAGALRETLKTMRKEKVPLLRWINFVHYGV